MQSYCQIPIVQRRAVERRQQQLPKCVRDMFGGILNALAAAIPKLIARGISRPQPSIYKSTTVFYDQLVAVYNGFLLSTANPRPQSTYPRSQPWGHSRAGSPHPFRAVISDLRLNISPLVILEP